MSERVPPVFILGSPRSFTSVVCAMLGQHPRAYGVPELNLFLEDTVRELWRRASGTRQFMIHGLLRTVAQLYAGEQTLASVDLARRWLLRRLDRRTGEVYRELERRVAPLRLVDKSPAYTAHPSRLERLLAAYPDAHFLHLVRHPRTQCRSLLRVGDGAMARLADCYDYSTIPPTLDPQLAWYQSQRFIQLALRAVPPERKLMLRGEDVLNRREAHMERLARWLGLDADPSSLAEMLHPERSVYAGLGPYGAHLGNDLSFLEDPAPRDGTVEEASLEGPLGWRPDGLGFREEVKRLARELGYA